MLQLVLKQAKSDSASASNQSGVAAASKDTGGGRWADGVLILMFICHMHIQSGQAALNM